MGKEQLSQGSSVSPGPAQEGGRGPQTAQLELGASPFSVSGRWVGGWGDRALDRRQNVLGAHQMPPSAGRERGANLWPLLKDRLVGPPGVDGVDTGARHVGLLANPTPPIPQWAPGTEDATSHTLKMVWLWWAASASGCLVLLAWALVAPGSHPRCNGPDPWLSTMDWTGSPSLTQRSIGPDKMAFGTFTGG